MYLKPTALACVMAFAASAAFAQDEATTPPDAGAEFDTATMGETWNDVTINAFFEDGTLDLLPEEDIRSNWTTLDGADQAQVASDCVAYMEAEHDPAAIDAPEREPDTTVEGVTGGTVPHETWEDLCEIVRDISGM